MSQDILRYKVVLLGSSHTGKTSIIHRYIHNDFSNNTQASTQAAFFQKKINHLGTDLYLDIWDTAGQERFHALTPMFYRDAQGAIIVYDVTDSNSFEKAKQWVNEIKQARGDMCHIVFVGNKIDLPSLKAISSDDAKKYSVDTKVDFYETSAKTGAGVENAFLAMAQKLAKMKPGGEQGSGMSRKRTSVRLDATETTESNDGCC